MQNRALGIADHLLQPVYHCPCPSACNYSSRVSSLVLDEWVLPTNYITVIVKKRPDSWLRMWHKSRANRQRQWKKKEGRVTTWLQMGGQGPTTPIHLNKTLNHTLKFKKKLVFPLFNSIMTDGPMDWWTNRQTVITPTSFNWHCLWASIWLTTCGERKLADWKIGRRSSRLFHKNFNNWERG